MFNINISQEVVEVEGERVFTGTISLDGMSEDFYASASYWSRDDYLAQWREGLRLLCLGSSKSAIITNMYDPQTANYIVWWVFYLMGGKVYIQNHILFMDDLETAFQVDELGLFVPDREVLTEDGELISEWEVPLQAIQDALGQIE